MLNCRARTSERRKWEEITEYETRPEQDHEVEILERGQSSSNSPVRYKRADLGEARWRRRRACSKELKATGTV
jgi:hypothetical protein